MADRRVHLFIRGRVQGVFFRETARQQAQRIGVSGWVRNLPDGRVEAVVEGPRAGTQAFVSWCRDGPPAAEVEDIQTQDEEATGEFPDFRVLR